VAKKVRKIGECCICGTRGELTYEHVPPRAAFNKARAIEYRLEEVIEKSTAGAKGTIRQGGIGYDTICRKCNNDIGSWYGGEYARWAKGCLQIIDDWQQQGRSQGVVTLHNVYPLRFLKQVVTCFFSLMGQYGGYGFARKNPGLVRFVLEKENKSLPSQYGFLFDLFPFSVTGKTSLRRSPLAANLQVVHDAAGNIIRAGNVVVFEEITHPPFRLVMALKGSFGGATDITHLKEYRYDEIVDLVLTLRIVKSSGYLPGS
jgi:hypothetical protein